MCLHILIRSLKFARFCQHGSSYSAAYLVAWVGWGRRAAMAAGEAHPQFGLVCHPVWQRQDQGPTGGLSHGCYPDDAQMPGGRSGVANNTWGISEAISGPSVNVFWWTERIGTRNWSCFHLRKKRKSSYERENFNVFSYHENPSLLAAWCVPGINEHVVTILVTSLMSRLKSC